MHTDAATEGAAPGQGGATDDAAILWRAAGHLVERGLHDLEGLSYQGLGPLAADTLERRGARIPGRLQQQQRAARVASLTAPELMSRARAACDGPMLVLKGPEVAARYPGRARGYVDLDLLVPDAVAVQRALVEFGFEELPDDDGRWVGINHLAPLRWPGLQLVVEVHSAPSWPEGFEPPDAQIVFEHATSSVLGQIGVLAPSPAHHALLLAAHAWSHASLGRLRDLLDVGALLAEADAEETARIADAWGIAMLWRTTVAAIDALVSGRRTWPLRLWAAHLPAVRVQTVLETHLERVLAPFWGYPVRVAAARSGKALVDEVRPAFDEGWGEKLRRSTAAFRRGLKPVTKHRRLLGDSARRGQRRNPRPDPGAEAGPDSRTP